MFCGLSEDIRKLLLLGIGAAAATAEKSQAMIGELVKKGELTVAQGRVLNEELRRSVKSGPEKGAGAAAPPGPAGDLPAVEDVSDRMERMSPAERAELFRRLNKMCDADLDQDGA